MFSPGPWWPKLDLHRGLGPARCCGQPVRLWSFCALLRVGPRAVRRALETRLIERFILVGTKHCSAAARRTLRSDLSFLARRVLSPAPEPGPTRARAGQGPLQPVRARGLPGAGRCPAHRCRSQRASGLIALGAGAGLIGPTCACERRTTSWRVPAGCSCLRGGLGRVGPGAGRVSARALEPRACGPSGVHRGRGRAQPAQRDESSHRLAGRRRGPARLSLARLRSTWVSRCAADIGLATFMAAAGVRCSQRLGDVVADLDPGDEAEAVSAAWASSGGR